MHACGGGSASDGAAARIVVRAQRTEAQQTRLFNFAQQAKLLNIAQQLWRGRRALAPADDSLVLLRRRVHLCAGTGVSRNADGLAATAGSAPMLRRAATGADLRAETRALRRAATDTVENATTDAMALEETGECVTRALGPARHRARALQLQRLRLRLTGLPLAAPASASRALAPLHDARVGQLERLLVHQARRPDLHGHDLLEGRLVLAASGHRLRLARARWAQRPR